MSLRQVLNYVEYCLIDGKDEEGVAKIRAILDDKPETASEEVIAVNAMRSQMGLPPLEESTVKRPQAMSEAEQMAEVEAMKARMGVKRKRIPAQPEPIESTE